MKRCQSITKSGLLENYQDIISIQQHFPPTGLSSKPFNFFGITNGVVPLEGLRKNSKYDTKFKKYQTFVLIFQNIFYSVAQ